MDSLSSQLIGFAKRTLIDIEHRTKAILRLHDEVKATREQQPRQAVTTTPSPEATAILNTLRAIHTEKTSSHSNQNTYQKRNLLIGGAGVIVLLVYTLVNLGMLCAMRDANKAASDSFAKTLCQMEAQTTAQQITACAAGEMLTQNVNSLKVEQRGKIKIGPITFVQLPEPLTTRHNQWGVNVSYQNYGRTAVLVIAVDKH